jgi:hypothetical protein
MSTLGNCPYCNTGQIKMEKKDVLGKMTKVYTCSNASWETQDGEMFELKKEATCSFRIWGNALNRWGKRGIGYQEVKGLLQNKETIVRLFSHNTKKEYYKHICLNKEFGISVIWDIDVKPEEKNIA